MNPSIVAADGNTHMKVVVVALLWAILTAAAVIALS